MSLPRTLLDLRKQIDAAKADPEGIDVDVMHWCMECIDEHGPAILDALALWQALDEQASAYPTATNRLRTRAAEIRKQHMGD